MAFRFFGTLVDNVGPVLLKHVVGSSVTVTVMDSVKLATTTGLIALGTTGALVHGHVNSIVTLQGMGLNTTGAAGATIGSFVNAYTTASDNATVLQVSAICDVSKFSSYTCDNNATSSLLGTTTGSGIAGYKTDILDEDTIAENSATTATAQYNILGTDPSATTTRAAYNIYESQMFGV